MEDKDSDDYELLPHDQLEQLRKEISIVKKNALGPGGKELGEAIERLNNSINKLITILEDAQQDIIDEYQESKPVEKLTQILDQNETIARALISINDKLAKPSDKSPAPVFDDMPAQPPRPQFQNVHNAQPQQNLQQNMQGSMQQGQLQQSMQPFGRQFQQNQPMQNQPNFNYNPPMQNQSLQNPQTFNYPQQLPPLPPLQPQSRQLNIPPLQPPPIQPDYTAPNYDIPPDAVQDPGPSMLPEHSKKKKFLGLM